MTNLYILIKETIFQLTLSLGILLQGFSYKPEKGSLGRWGEKDSPNWLQITLLANYELESFNLFNLYSRKNGSHLPISQLPARQTGDTQQPVRVI